MALSKEKARMLNGVKKDLTKCAQALAAKLMDEELIDILGKDVAEKVLKDFARKAANRMANQVRGRVERGVSISSARISALQDYNSRHYRMFRQFKTQIIGQYLANNNLSSIVAEHKGNYIDLSSKLFSDSEFTAKNISGGVARIQSEETKLVMGYVAAKLGKIADKYKLSFEQLLPYLVEPQKTTPIIDSYYSGAVGTTIQDDLARVIKDVNDKIAILRENAGIPRGTSNPRKFVSTVVYDKEKLANIDPSILTEFGVNPADLSYDEVSVVYPEVFAKFMEPLIDWEDSFPDNDNSTLQKRRETLEITYKNILSEDRIGKPAQVRAGYTAKLHGGTKQIYYKDGSSYMKAMVAFSQPNLIKSLQSSAFSLGRDVGIVSVFGPVPDEGLEHLIKEWKRVTPLGPDLTSNLADIRGWFDWHTNSTPSHADMTTEMALKLLKAWPQIMFLGKGGVMSLGDLANYGMQFQFQGLPKPIRSTAEAAIRYFSKAAREDLPEIARIFGFTTDAYTAATHIALADYKINSGEWQGWVEKMIASLSKWGGLEVLDMVQRLGITIAWSQQFAHNFSLPYSELKNESRLLLQQQGFTPNQWNKIRTQKSLIMSLHGKSLFVPTEAYKLSDAFIADLFNTPLTHKISIQRNRSLLAIRLNSMLKAQSDSVVPSFNPTYDRNQDELARAVLETARAGTTGVNWHYVLHKLMYQFTSWSTNYQMTVLKRTWQGPGSGYSKTAACARLVIGTTVTNTLLDMVLAAITNDDRHSKTPIYTRLARQAIAQNAGRWRIVVNIIEQAFLGHSSGMGRMVASSQVGGTIKKALNIVTKKDHLGALYKFVGDTASVHIYIEIALGLLKRVADLES